MESRILSSGEVIHLRPRRPRPEVLVIGNDDSALSCTVSYRLFCYIHGGGNNRIVEGLLADESRPEVVDWVS